MLVYHYSTTYRGDTSLTNDYNHRYEAAEPLLLALRRGRDAFETLLLGLMYLTRAEAQDHPGKRWLLDYVKDATEALFEFVRETEFADVSASRLRCVYYFREQAAAVQSAYDDWINCGDATKDEVKLLELEVAEEGLYEYDQAYYNRAYDLMQTHRIDEAMDCARAYFSGRQTDAPLLELLSGGENRVLREIAY